MSVWTRRATQCHASQRTRAVARALPSADATKDEHLVHTSCLFTIRIPSIAIVGQSRWGLLLVGPLQHPLWPNQFLLSLAGLPRLYGVKPEAAANRSYDTLGLRYIRIPCTRMDAPLPATTRAHFRGYAYCIVRARRTRRGAGARSALVPRRNRWLRVAVWAPAQLFVWCSLLLPHDLGAPKRLQLRQTADRTSAGAGAAAAAAAAAAAEAEAG